MASRRSMVRRLAGCGTVVLAGCLGIGGSDVEDSDGDGVIDSEDYAPRDPGVQRKSDVESEDGGPEEVTTEHGMTERSTEAPNGGSRGDTSPTSGEGPSSVWDFEDGSIGAWSPLKLNDNNQSFDGNNWSVTDDAIAGEYSLHVVARGDGFENVIATDDRVVDMSRDFTFSFLWRTPDPSNRGVGFGLVKQDGTDLRNIPNSDLWSELYQQNTIGFGFDSDAISRDGSPYKGNGGFSGDSFSRRSYAADTVHSATVVKRGDEATLYWDEEEIHTSDVRTGGQYRLSFRTSGTWGDETRVTFDEITLTYG